MNQGQLYLKQELKMYKECNYRNKNDYVAFLKWLIKNGESFQDVDLEFSVKISKDSKSLIKYCYKNCWDILLDYPQLKYYCGYAWNDRITLPTQHAWLVNTKNQVIEPTFVIYGKELSEKYFGIHIPTKKLNALVFRENAVQNYLFDYFMDLQVKNSG